MLKKDGVLILEFPSIEKCARALLSASSDKSYTEAVRGFYAFDINQINMKQEYAPYVMGYGEKNMVLLLKKSRF